ncbi:MAG TPA: hypothetical protein VHR46_04620 [Gaiella sp.]|jgi:hypothetical protein|nr:hypothetical protein [Gaiella sp.]
MERVVARWSTLERETDAGAVESRQWIELPRELVAPDEGGARELGRRYLAEVARFSRGLVRPRVRRDGVALVLAGAVTLLRFGSPELGHDAGSVECRYPISGGLLVARPGGSLLVAQRPGVELELVVAGYFPRLGGSARRRSLRRALYTALQARAHRAVGRRFFEGVVREVGA